MAGSARPLPAAGGRDVGVLALCLGAVPLLVWLGNPAVAFLAGAAIVLAFNRQPLPGGSLLGPLCLQAAIVLLGLELDLTTLWTLSVRYLGGIAGYVLATLALGFGLGRLLKVEAPASTLVSSGTAICGGTAIATLSGIVRAQPHQTGVALAVVFLLNAVALVGFPVIGHWLELSQHDFGVWVALAIHDTSSVVATAKIYGAEAAQVATTLKLGRTLWLVPLALAVSLSEHRPGQRPGASGAPSLRRPRRVKVPVFIVLFVAAAAVGTWLPIPGTVSSLVASTSDALLVTALFLVGTELTRGTARRIRGRMLWQALVLWLIAAPATLAAVVWLG